MKQNLSNHNFKGAFTSLVKRQLMLMGNESNDNRGNEANDNRGNEADDNGGNESNDNRRNEAGRRTQEELDSWQQAKREKL